LVGEKAVFGENTEGVLICVKFENSINNPQIQNAKLMCHCEEVRF
jgi:hypothetical protein